MTKVIGLTLLIVGAAGVAFGATTVPEIDASSGMSAITLLSGALMVMRSRRGRK